MPKASEIYEGATSAFGLNLSFFNVDVLPQRLINMTDRFEKLNRTRVSAAPKIREVVYLSWYLVSRKS